MKLIVALSAVLLCACGSSPPPAAPAPALVEPSPSPAQPEAGAPAPTPEPAPLPPAPPWDAPGAPPSYVSAALVQVPASVRYVAAIDLPRLAGTPVGDKLREALIGAAVELPASCKSLNPTALGNVILAGGGDGGELVGIAAGKMAERPVITCLTALVKSRGGALKNKKLAGRTAYYATGSADDNGWITWTRAGTPIMAGDEAMLTATLDAKAAKISPELAALVASADHRRMMWGAAKVTSAEVQTLPVPAGMVTGPVTIRFGIDLGAELELDVAFGFASTEEANRVAQELRKQLGEVRQGPPLDSLLRDVKLGVHGRDLRVIIHLDAAATTQALGFLNMK